MSPLSAWGLAADAGGVSGMLGRHAGGFGDRAVKLALQHQGMCHQVLGLASRCPELAGTAQFGLGRDAIAELQIGLRLQQAQAWIVRIALDGVSGTRFGQCGAALLHAASPRATMSFGSPPPIAFEQAASPVRRAQARRCCDLVMAGAHIA
jgi:hypothetical protein